MARTMRTFRLRGGRCRLGCGSGSTPRRGACERPSRRSDRCGDEPRRVGDRPAAKGGPAIAERAGHTLLDLAFGWLLAFRPVASVIAGATTAEQVRANVHAGRWQPDANVLAEVQRVLRPAA